MYLNTIISNKLCKQMCLSIKRFRTNHHFDKFCIVVILIFLCKPAPTFQPSNRGKYIEGG